MKNQTLRVWDMLLILLFCSCSNQKAKKILNEIQGQKTVFVKSQKKMSWQAGTIVLTVLLETQYYVMTTVVQ